MNLRSKVFQVKIYLPSVLNIKLRSEGEKNPSLRETWASGSVQRHSIDARTRVKLTIVLKTNVF